MSLCLGFLNGNMRFEQMIAKSLPALNSVPLNAGVQCLRHLPNSSTTSGKSLNPLGCHLTLGVLRYCSGFSSNTQPGDKLIC